MQKTWKVLGLFNSLKFNRIRIPVCFSYHTKYFKGQKRWTNNQKYLLLSTQSSKIRMQICKILFNTFNTMFNYWIFLEKCWVSSRNVLCHFYKLAQIVSFRKRMGRKGLWISAILFYILTISHLFWSYLACSSRWLFLTTTFLVFSLLCFLFVKHTRLDLQSTSASWGQIKTSFFKLVPYSTSFHCEVACYLRQTNINHSENSLFLFFFFLWLKNKWMVCKIRGLCNHWSGKIKEECKIPTTVNMLI